MVDVVLHIGLHKTGTTSIQVALSSSADALAEQGVAEACASRRDLVWGIDDLLGRRFNKDDAAGQSGAWQRLVAQIDQAAVPQVVVSEELLSLARPRQVRQLARSLDKHRLHVVVGLRDLARTLPSAWQQEVSQGRRYTWRDFMASVRGDGDAPVSAGVAFWLRFDVLRILDVWEELVPRERIHLLTVPPPGSDHDVLLDRFADVLGVPAGVLRDRNPERNRSLGAVEVEVLRRLNERVDLTPAQYSLLVSTGVRPALLGGSTRPLRLPADQDEWVASRTELLVRELRTRGYTVHGDLDELTPAPSGGGRRLDDVTGPELLAATEACLVGLAEARLRTLRRLGGVAGALERDTADDTREADAGPASELTGAAGLVVERLAAGLAEGTLPRPRQRRCLRLAEQELAARMPDRDRAAEPEPADVDESRLLAATEDAVTILAVAYAEDRAREGADEVHAEAVAWHRRMAGSVRAAGFGLRVSALERADRSAVLGLLARTYRSRLNRHVG